MIPPLDLGSQPVRNSALSPKLDVATTNWSYNTVVPGSNARVAVTDLPGASWAYTVTAAAATSSSRLYTYFGPLRAGAVYTSVMWVKADAGTVWSTRALSKDGSVAWSTATQFTMTGSWQRIVHTFTAPDDVSGRVEVRHAPSAADSTIYATLFTVTPGITPPATHVDGFTPGWVWIGTAGDSESVGYPYTLESIAGPPLASFGSAANSGSALDPAAWDPVGRGVMALTVVDLLAVPAIGVNDNVLIYGTNSDVPSNSQLTQRIISTDGLTMVMQTRRTNGASPAVVALGSTPGRVVLASGVAPGGRSFSAANTGELHVDTTVTVSALTHSYVRWYPASAAHTPVAAFLLPGYDATTLWRAMAWLARQYGAAVPAGY